MPPNNIINTKHESIESSNDGDICYDNYDEGRKSSVLGHQIEGESKNTTMLPVLNVKTKMVS